MIELLNTGTAQRHVYNSLYILKSSTRGIQLGSSQEQSLNVSIRTNNLFDILTK